VLRDGEVSSEGVAGPLDVTDWLFAPSVTARFGARRSGG
jgi:hypothetical protein